MAGFLKKVFSFADKTDQANKDNAEENLTLTPFEAYQLALQKEKQQEDEKELKECKDNSGDKGDNNQAQPPLQNKALPATPIIASNQQDDSKLNSFEASIIDVAASVNNDNISQFEDLKNKALAPIAPEVNNVTEKNSEPEVNSVSEADILSQVKNERLTKQSSHLNQPQVNQPQESDTQSPLVNDFINEQKNLPAKGRIKIGADIETVEETTHIDVEPALPVKLSWFERLRKGLSRSSRQLGDSINSIFTKRKLDEDTLQDLEDVLIASDLGLETAMRITDSLASGRYGKNISSEEVRTIMQDEIEKVLTPVAKPLELDLAHKPHVILVVGVNGTGKTTTIGKLAAKLSRGGLKVMLAAGDTFRAAAIEQLHIWGKRTNSPVISTKLGADAASLAFEAYEKALEAGSDVLIIDTAGRLQNKTELMDELAKIVRVLGKHNADAPHTILQTLDATTGQNALNQVEIFRNVAGVNGLVMTKLDGTARGGILVAIAAKFKLPVYFIGVGEDIDDLEPFKANEFAQAIATL